MAYRFSRFFQEARSIALLLGLVAWGGGTLAQAQPDRAEAAVIAVIQQQLDAFAADDAEQAFKYASPGIKASSGSVKNFMSLVKFRYGVVYRHASAAFFKPVIAGKEALVKVRLTDENGVNWIAAYTLERHKKNEWLISGCHLLEDQGNFV
jgi:hypothetical protein